MKHVSKNDLLCIGFSRQKYENIIIGYDNIYPWVKMGISIFYLVFIENDANCLFWIFKLHMDIGDTLVPDFPQSS